MISSLHDYQASAIERLRASLRAGRRRPMLQAPTGAGKTLIAAAVTEYARTKSKRVAFCVPAIELIDQTIRAFHEEGIDDVGVIQANHHMTDWSKPIQVCSVQTIKTRGYPLADVVIVDEGHKRFDTYENWMHHPDWQKVPFIGLSATPWARGLGKVFDDLIIAATTRELIDKGRLSPFRVFAPSHPDLSGVRTKAGDYVEADLTNVVQTQNALVADVIETWLKLGQGRPTVCFAVNRDHAKLLQKRFEEHGIESGYIDCKTARNERDAVRMKFHAGLIKVVCNVDCLGIGVDWDIRCVVLARPTKSEIRFVQNVGRGLRLADGKEDCLILDHSDTHLRLGFVTDIHHPALDDGKPRKLGETKEREAPLPKPCPKCAALKPPMMQTCPECGFTPERRCLIRELEGDLAEVKEIERKKAKRRNRVFTAEDKRRFYQELLGYALERGFKNGWVSHKYRERFDVWPNAHADAPPIMPSFDTLNWIKSRNIAWARRRDRHETQTDG